MNYRAKINWAFASAIIASLCWIIGDMFVAGFNANPADYPLFSQTYADKVDVGLATLMLKGSTNRLMFGALIASMTASLFLPGVWLAYQFIKDKSKWYAWGTYYLLVLSVLLMPLGHAVFFFTGEIYKAVYHTGTAAQPYLLEVASGFLNVHYIAWGTAILVLLAGWLIFSILVFSGKTILPKWAGFISPVFISIYQASFHFLLPASDIKGYLVSATFNIAYLIFFILLFIYFKKRLIEITH